MAITYEGSPIELNEAVAVSWRFFSTRASVSRNHIWRDTKTNGALLAVPARIRGRKGSGDSVTVEFTFDLEEDEWRGPTDAAVLR